MTVDSTAVRDQRGRSRVPGQPPAAPYDPATETDALIRAHVEVDAVTGDTVFRGTLYPVWSVVLNLRASNYDWERVRRMFPELSLEALRAAERFWMLHPDDIREFVEE